MCPNIDYDECLICHTSLIQGVDLYRFIISDTLCYKCRRTLKIKFGYHKFEGYPLLTLYNYEFEVSSLLIRFKDYLDMNLGSSFLKPVVLPINILFKDYKVILIPSSNQMKIRRGFNHLNIMLSDIKLPIIDCLEKEDTIQRFSENRDVNFRIIDDSLRFDKVLLFDDVITSGSSLKAALKILAPISNKIVLLSVINNWNEVK